ncbi:MAG: VOC family protein [Betaproteobacteria bacterium]|nr:VOC family protein [Betaproteobacteria bacterium]
MSNAPEGYSTLTPVIISKDARVAIEDYKNALGAEMPCEPMACSKTRKIFHAALNIGEATLFVCDECPELGMNVTGHQQFYLYVKNVDNLFNTAKAAGWNVDNNPEDMFWGDRVATVKDRNGNTWKLAQRVRDVSPEEMSEAMKKMSETA